MNTYDEFENYISTQKKLKPLSIRTYRNQYNTLRQWLNEFSSMDESDIVSFIIDLEKYGDPIKGEMLSNNTIINYLSIIINIRYHYSPEINNNEQIIALREKYNGIKLRNKKIKNQSKLEELPSHQQLLNHLNQMFEQEQWRDYILLFLLINYHTRNKDLNVVLVSNIRLARDNHNNYLVVKPSHINYVKFNYKTSDRYGRMTFSIKHKRFREAVKNYIEELGGFKKDNDMFFLMSSNGKRIEDDSVAKWIRARTLQNISSADYNKIILSEAITRKDYKFIDEISIRRGTSVPVLMSEYDLKL
jgi:hypothetical protein